MFVKGRASELSDYLMYAKNGCGAYMSIEDKTYSTMKTVANLVEIMYQKGIISTDEIKVIAGDTSYRPIELVESMYDAIKDGN